MYRPGEAGKGGGCGGPPMLLVDAGRIFVGGGRLRFATGGPGPRSSVMDAGGSEERR